MEWWDHSFALCQSVLCWTHLPKGPQATSQWPTKGSDHSKSDYWNSRKPHSRTTRGQCSPSYHYWLSFRILWPISPNRFGRFCSKVQRTTIQLLYRDKNRRGRGWEENRAGVCFWVAKFDRSGDTSTQHGPISTSTRRYQRGVVEAQAGSKRLSRIENVYWSLTERWSRSTTPREIEVKRSQ